MVKGKSRRRKRTYTYVVRRVKYQRGSSNRRYDRRLRAMKPGLRKTAHGTKYWEVRKNRSDLNGI